MVVRSNWREKMVNLSIIVEGGGSPTNVSVDTANNAESLRQSLHSFFSRLLKRDDVQITIYLGYGYRNAAKQFSTSSIIGYLFVDSDQPQDCKYRWFDKLVDNFNPDNTIIIPEDKKNNVFFMVQEMEAWFLKQIDCIIRWANNEEYKRKHPEEDIKEHSVIKHKNIEDIKKPSDKLAIILRHYFEKNKKGAQYGKLKTVPALLDALNVCELVSCDQELQRFIQAINNANGGVS